jgi:hypothetical protein
VIDAERATRMSTDQRGSGDALAPVRDILDGDSGNAAAAKPLHPLLEAVKREGVDDVEVLREILDAKVDKGEDKSPLLAADESGMTALMHAAWKGKVKTVKFLLEQVGSNPVSAGESRSIHVLLHILVVFSRLECLLY